MLTPKSCRTTHSAAFQIQKNQHKAKTERLERSVFFTIQSLYRLYTSYQFREFSVRKGFPSWRIAVL